MNARITSRMTRCAGFAATVGAILVAAGAASAADPIANVDRRSDVDAGVATVHNITRTHKGEAATQALPSPDHVLRGTPPANDNCANAIALPASPFQIDTSTATTDGFAEPALSPFVGETAKQDVWYTFMPTVDGVLRVSMCNSDFSAFLFAHANAFCPNGPDEAFFTTIAGDCGIGFPFQTEGDIPIQAGVPVLIRFGGYDWTAQGNPELADNESGLLDVTWEELASTPSICTVGGDNLNCQGTGPDFFGDFGAWNSTVGGIIRADDFNVVTLDGLNPGSLEEVCFYGTYTDDLAPPTDAFVINIYNNVNGGTDTPVAQLTEGVDFTVTRQDSGSLVAGAVLFEYRAVLNTGVSLPDGCYFLEIANDTLAQNQAWFWANAVDAADAGLGNQLGNRYSLATQAGTGGVPGSYDPTCDYRLFLDFAWCLSGTNFLPDDSGLCSPAVFPDCIPCDTGDPGTTAETEACGTRTNDGCNLVVPAFEPAAAGQSICGTIDQPATTLADGDEDWFMLTTTGPVDLDLTFQSNFYGRVFIFNAPLEVGGLDCADPNTQVGFNFTSLANATLIVPTLALPVAGDWVFLVEQDPGRAFLIDCVDAFEDEDYRIDIAVTIPAPTGACCIDLGGGIFQCLEGVTEDDCVNGNGGTYQGDDMTCADVNNCEPVVVPCPCDIDDSGTQDLNDYFAYLGDFFAQLDVVNPQPGSADFDGSGLVDLNDYFAFLGCLPTLAAQTPCP